MGFWGKLSYRFAQLMLYEDVLLGFVAVISGARGDVPKNEKLTDENDKVKRERDEMFDGVVDLCAQPGTQRIWTSCHVTRVTAFVV